MAANLHSFRRVFKLTVFLLLVASPVFLLCSCGGGSSTDTTDFGDGNLTALLDMINAERSVRSMSPLTLNTPLSSLASEPYCDYLYSTSAMSYAQDADGKTPEDRADDAGVSYVSAAQAGSLISDNDVNQAYTDMVANYESVLFNSSYTQIGLGFGAWT